MIILRDDVDDVVHLYVGFYHRVVYDHHVCHHFCVYHVHAKPKAAPAAPAAPAPSGSFFYLCQTFYHVHDYHGSFHHFYNGHFRCHDAVHGSYFYQNDFFLLS